MQNAPREHSAILSTFIKLLYAIKIFVLSIQCEWPLKIGFTVLSLHLKLELSKGFFLKKECMVRIWIFFNSNVYVLSLHFMEILKLSINEILYVSLFLGKTELALC